MPVEWTIASCLRTTLHEGAFTERVYASIQKCLFSSRAEGLGLPAQGFFVQQMSRSLTTKASAQLDLAGSLPGSMRCSHTGLQEFREALCTMDSCVIFTQFLALLRFRCWGIDGADETVADQHRSTRVIPPHRTTSCLC